MAALEHLITLPNHYFLRISAIPGVPFSNNFYLILLRKYLTYFSPL